MHKISLISVLSAN